MHVGFLRYANYRWLKISLLLCAIAIAAYASIDVRPRPNGGSWYGYTLGTIGVFLILWLTLLGLRKRAMTRGRWSLKAWTSAHVYLGLGLIVIATLHTGFQFGWNVHTLAYALMMLVIVSGIWGVSAYAALPAKLSANRQEMTEGQMLEGIRKIDRELHDAAPPLEGMPAELVRASLQQDPFGHGLWVRFSGHDPNCATERAYRTVRGLAVDLPGGAAAVLVRVDELLDRKKAALGQLRRHLRIKALLEIWLYIHVPATFALIAALTAHVVSVFFYW